MVSDKKRRKLSGISPSLLLVTLRNIVLAIIGCDSACFSPAFIFIRWARGPPKPACNNLVYKGPLRAGPLYAT